MPLLLLFMALNLTHHHLSSLRAVLVAPLVLGCPSKVRY
jgi:hypothetical protein